jgi:thiol-disulfide isomerase/thioredoxin
MMRFQLDPKDLPASQVQNLGFEAMDAAGVKNISQAALRQAREKNLEIMGIPEVGQPYEFSLTSMEGKVITSKDLRGKVILIDCWATWCGPCMQQLPELKAIYESWHAQGLEMVGLSFDKEPSAAADIFKQLDISWALIVVPNNDEVRQLWREASRIETFPTVLLIDRSGVLRMASSPTTTELTEKITELIGDPQPLK